MIIMAGMIWIKIIDYQLVQLKQSPDIIIGS